jgi:hypothetical protein
LFCEIDPKEFKYGTIVAICVNIFSKKLAETIDDFESKHSKNKHHLGFHEIAFAFVERYETNSHRNIG